MKMTKSDCITLNKSQQKIILDCLNAMEWEDNFDVYFLEMHEKGTPKEEIKQFAENLEEVFRLLGKSIKAVKAYNSLFPN